MSKLIIFSFCLILHYSFCYKILICLTPLFNQEKGLLEISKSMDVLMLHLRIFCYQDPTLTFFLEGQDIFS